MCWWLEMDEKSVYWWCGKACWLLLICALSLSNIPHKVYVSQSELTLEALLEGKGWQADGGMRRSKIWWLVNTRLPWYLQRIHLFTNRFPVRDINVSAELFANITTSVCCFDMPPQSCQWWLEEESDSKSSSSSNTIPYIGG